MMKLKEIIEHNEKAVTTGCLCVQQEKDFTFTVSWGEPREGTWFHKDWKFCPVCGSRQLFEASGL